MAGKNQHLADRNKNIRKDFQKLLGGGQKSEEIYKELAKKYFMSPVTIDDIVWQRGVYKTF